MAQGNVVAEFGDAFNRRDVAAMQRLVSDDFVLIPIRAALEDISYAGREGVAQWVRNVDDIWLGLRVEIDSSEQPAPDTLLVFGRTVGHGRESAAPVELECTWVGRVRDGLITRIETFLDRDAARRAAAPQS
jgi:ketosteroid isomerase-like protein